MAGFIRVITPKRQVWINPKTFPAELQKELKDLGKQAEQEMAKPTRRWAAPPSFQSDFAGGTSRIVMTVHPVGAQAEKYERIDFGTRPHVIRPRTGKRFLRFQPKYLASTIPNRLWSRLAKRSGAFVYVHIVHNPGIRARNFSKQVYKNINPEFRRRMRNLIRRELRRGGYPISV